MSGHAVSAARKLNGNQLVVNGAVSPVKANTAKTTRTLALKITATLQPVQRALVKRRVLEKRIDEVSVL